MDKFQRRSAWMRSNNLQYDLAMEAHDLLRGQQGGEVPGVAHTEEDHGLATVSTVTILDQRGSQAMGKPQGTYITITTNSLKINNRADHQRLAEIIADSLGELVSLTPEDTVLIVGLGNWRATPDALGPRIADRIIATRHLAGNVPPEILAGVRPVATLTPGVLGLTGIETAETVKGIVDNIRPKLVIACDALAAGSVSRIGTTIQLADTGVNPGSGLGNHRVGLNRETLGVPVIAVGVPTVVNGAIIAHSVLENFLEQLENKPHLGRLLQDIPQPLLDGAIQQVLEPFGSNLSVTPKEIDDLITNTATIIAQAVTQVLHPNMNESFANVFV